MIEKDKKSAKIRKIYRSDEIIKDILDALNLTRETPSTYVTSMAQDGKFTRLRVSDHGVNMSSWYKSNVGEEVPLTDSVNLALTFLPNKEECMEQNIPYPPKAINKTQVFKRTDRYNFCRFTLYLCFLEIYGCIFIINS